MNIISSPALISSACVTVYWLTVIIKAILITQKIGKAPNVIPKEIIGLLSRLVMLPLIIFWIYLSWQASFYTPSKYQAFAWLGALSATIALVLSFYCWYYMGREWRIGIDPNEKNELITSGPYRYIRHPIYTLSMLLVFGSLLSVQTQGMLLIFCTHWVLFFIEAYREERYLTSIHGLAYEAYIKQTNRFLSLRIWRNSNV